MSPAGSPLIRRFGVFRLFRQPNPQGTQKIQILRSERPRLRCFRHGLLCRFFLRLIQPDGRLQHQHHLKPLGPDVAHYAGDLIGFRNRFVDGFAQLLNEIAYLTIQIQPPRAPQRFRIADDRVFLTILRFAAKGNAVGCGCYTFRVVEYVKLGRKLGIGTRVAAKILRNRAQNAVSPVEKKTPAQGTPFQPPVGERSERPGLSGKAKESRDLDAKKSTDTRTVARNLTRGAVRGGQGFWKPFARIIHALWHEVTGVFFALFALFFIQNTWRVHNAWRSGPEHRHFIVYLLLALVFAYFSITAFATSRRHKH